MKKFSGLLFCTDLDGTLLTSDRSVSRENLDAIEYFKAEGGRFAFVTGREPPIAKGIYDILRPNAPYGTLNGAGIYDGEKEQFLWNARLPEEVRILLRDAHARFPEIGYRFVAERVGYLCQDNPAFENVKKEKNLQLIPCALEEVRESVLKVVFATDDEVQMQGLMDLLNGHPLAERFDFIRSEKQFYEILPKGVSKGAVLLKIAEMLGIDPKKTIAVGDYNNDISMIRAAGLGFAVSNAVEEAKAAADYVTVSNDENAIAAIIDGLDRGIYSAK
jgi:Cof subfamily protein (haloacid dehalogenase superfamily)